MAKPEWGLKRTCLGCGTRFYDMQRDPIVCPSCEAEFDPLALVRPRRARAAAAASQAKAKAAAAALPEAEAEEEVVEEGAIEIDDAAIELDDDDDDDIIPDDDDDDDDDVDVSEVVDKAKDDPNPDV